MRRQDVIAHGVEMTKGLAARYFVGFDESNRTRQAPGLPNHFAWNLGHLGLTMHRIAGMLDGKAIPEADFLTGGHASGGGNAERFAVESVAFGSAPVDAPGEYPSIARCVAVFNNAVDRLAAALRGASDTDLERTVPWGAGESTLWELGLRMVFHNGDHVGEIADLRRALGFKRVM